MASTSSQSNIKSKLFELLKKIHLFLVKKFEFFFGKLDKLDELNNFVAFLENKLIDYLVDNKDKQLKPEEKSVKKNIILKTKKERLGICKRVVKIFVVWFILSAIIVFLWGAVHSFLDIFVNYLSGDRIDGIKQIIYIFLNSINIIIGAFYNFAVKFIEIINIIFSALIGALIGYILSDGMDPLDDWFDKDIIDECVISRINKKFMHKNDNDKYVIRFVPDNDSEKPEEDPRKSTRINCYEIFKYKYKWDFKKFRVRCRIKRDSEEIILDEFPDKNNEGELFFPRLNYPVTIPMCLELRIKKPKYNESAKGTTYIYTELRLYQDKDKKIEIQNENGENVKEIVLYDYVKNGNNKKIAICTNEGNHQITKENLESCAKNCLKHYLEFFIHMAETYRVYNEKQEPEEDSNLVFRDFCGAMSLSVTESDLSNYVSRLFDKILDIDEKLLKVYFPRIGFYDLKKYYGLKAFFEDVSKFENEELITDSEVLCKIKTGEINKNDINRKKFLSIRYTKDEAKYYLTSNGLADNNKNIENKATDISNNNGEKFCNIEELKNQTNELGKELKTQLNDITESLKNQDTKTLEALESMSKKIEKLMEYSNEYNQEIIRIEENKREQRTPAQIKPPSDRTEEEHQAEYKRLGVIRDNTLEEIFTIANDYSNKDIHTITTRTGTPYRAGQLKYIQQMIDNGILPEDVQAVIEKLMIRRNQEAESATNYYNTYIKK